MYKALIYTLLLLLPAFGARAEAVEDAADTSVAPMGRVIPLEGAFLMSLHDRDSVLIADQFIYGFELRQVEEGTIFTYPQWENSEEGGVMLLSQWITDTLKVSRARKNQPSMYDIRGSVLMTSFDEGTYELPQISLQRLSKDGVLDTLVFDPLRVEIKTMPVDTATFVPHDIKGQIRYPVTVAELLPWFTGIWLVAMAIIFVVCMIIMHRSRAKSGDVRREPAHIVALRKLDEFRGSKMWAPERQKAFYSGVTDALREYIASRYEIGAMEMTTAEIVRELKGTEGVEEYLGELKELFERADFVKFAKYIASDEDNASVLPVAVRFVTSTYQSDIEDMSAQVGDVAQHGIGDEKPVQTGDGGDEIKEEK